jgi:CheY-like chemotaxis protein
MADLRDLDCSIGTQTLRAAACTILIIEQRLALADLLETLLTAEGYRVLVAPDCREGVRLLALVPGPDLVICDHPRPIGEGSAALRALRGHGDIPCIVICDRAAAASQEVEDGTGILACRPFGFTAGRAFPFAALLGAIAAEVGVRSSGARC